jgi:tetratricopeptide (TPR) repeat protein
VYESPGKGQSPIANRQSPIANRQLAIGYRLLAIGDAGGVERHDEPLYPRHGTRASRYYCTAIKDSFNRGDSGLLKGKRLPDWLLILVLAGATIAAYLPVWHAGFIWDDDKFLLENPLIKHVDGLYSFWFTSQAPDYFPLTSTTLWLEWRLWGAEPLGYHLVNVLLHSLSALLLWRILLRLNIPGAWLAAVLFAVHPVNVQSVAWVTERKNTLAMVFYLLSILWYLKSETRNPKPEIRSPQAETRSPSSIFHLPSPIFYLLSLLAFLLALLGKTAVAPLPLVLLLIECWRSPRIAHHASRITHHALRLAPFFVLSLVLGLLSLWFQYHRAIANDIVRTDSFSGRLAGAGYAIWFYSYKAIWPLHLSAVYPRWQIDPTRALSYAPLLAIIAALLLLWRFRRSWGRPALFGSGYFVIMLLPVLGFLNIYFMRYSLVADHWQYFAIIGPITLVAAGLSSKFKVQSSRSEPRPNSRTPFNLFNPLAACASRPFAAALVLTLAALTWQQTTNYKNLEIFWRSVIRSNPGSSMAHNNFGKTLFQARRVDEAIEQFQTALEIQPVSANVHNNLGNALLQKGSVEEASSHLRQAVDLEPRQPEFHYNLGQFLFRTGRTQEALAQFDAALDLDPNLPTVHNNLGYALLQLGRLDEALAHFRKAAQLEPGSSHAQYALGFALAKAGQLDEAIVQFRTALQLEPNFAPAHNQLGQALVQKGQLQEALAHFQRAVQIEPDYAPACNSLAWLLATSPEPTLRNGARAIELASHAEQLSRGQNLAWIGTLAAAYAEAGRFSEAIATSQRALRLAAAQTNETLIRALQAQLRLYESNLPFRQTNSSR